MPSLTQRRSPPNTSTIAPPAAGNNSDQDIFEERRIRRAASNARRDERNTAFARRTRIVLPVASALAFVGSLRWAPALIGLLPMVSFRGMIRSVASERRYEPTDADRCWMRRAFASGEFRVFSHRSFADAQLEGQPSCAEALGQLRRSGVRGMDLDLILALPPIRGGGNGRTELLVAHPTEYAHPLSDRAPCSLLPLTSLLNLLDDDGDGDGRAIARGGGGDATLRGGGWFLTLEPKAQWGGDRRAAADDRPWLRPPLEVLEALLEVARRHRLDPSRCGLILPPDELAPDLDWVVAELRSHCALVLSVRRDVLDAAAAAAAADRYDYLMPTIEFHPLHENHGSVATASSDPVRRLADLADLGARKHIYWVVDGREDLALASSLRPHGIASNRPLQMVKYLGEGEWCRAEAGCSARRTAHASGVISVVEEPTHAALLTTGSISKKSEHGMFLSEHRLL